MGTLYKKCQQEMPTGSAGIYEQSKSRVDRVIEMFSRVETPPDPAPGVACIMFGSKPRTMYAAKTWHGPTEDELARNEATEDERRRYEV